jgi:hypothetical protein
MNAVEEAIKNRDEFLKKYPHMQEYQDKIDAIMDKASSDPQARMQVLSMLMEGNLLEIQKKLISLSENLAAIANGEETP